MTALLLLCIALVALVVGKRLEDRRTRARVRADRPRAAAERRSARHPDGCGAEART